MHRFGSTVKRLLRAWPWWALPALAVVFLWKIALTGRILAGVDVFTYFYPYRAFAAEALQSVRLPLWNPHLFLGAPFFADSQAGVLYPFNIMLTSLPIPYQVSASILLHLALGGWFAFLFARRSLQLSRAAAFTAAAMFALGGFLLAQAEHVNQLNVSVWLPLMLYLWDRARVWDVRPWRERIRAAFWPLSALAGVIALCVFAGHAQSLYICMAALALYALASRLPKSDESHRRDRGERRGIRPSFLSVFSAPSAVNLLIIILVIGAVSALGLALAGVQLFPTQELAGLSLRGEGMTYREAVSFSLRPRLFLTALFPAYRAGVFSEYVAYVGLFGMALALVGFWRSPERSIACIFALMVGAGLFLALGGFNPVYYVLYRFVPGFDLFRVPARWMMLYHTGIAMLAGMGVESLRRANCQFALQPDSLPSARSAVKVSAAVIVLALAAGAYWMERPSALVALVWLACAVAAAALIHLAARPGRLGAWAQGLLVAAVVAELFLASRSLALNRPTAPQAYTSMRPSVAHILADSDRGRMLSLSDLTFDPGDLAEIRSIYGQTLPQDSIYDYVVATKQKEILVPNLPMRYGISSLDGYGGGILPLSGYYDLQRLFLPADRLSRDGRLREGLTEIPDGNLLGAFGVEYIIADKAYDIWRDGAYYDLSHRATLEAGDSVEVPLGLAAEFPADAIGIVSYLEGMRDMPDGTVIAEVMLEYADVDAERIPILAGRDTSEGRYDAAVGHASTRAVSALRDDPEVTCYLATLALNKTARIQRMEIARTDAGGTLVIRGATLLNSATGTHYPLVVSTAGRFELVHSGDVKIYRNLDAKPRLYVAFSAEPVGSSEEAIDRILSGEIDAQTAVAIVGGRALSGNGSAQVEVLADEPERTAARVRLDAPGYLVLSDTDYPGWRATVDDVPAPILRANGFVRAVYLEPGDHVVEFAFKPPSLTIGAACSAAAFLVWLAAAVIVALRRRVHPQRGA
jgi:hypothetical protein